MTPTFPLVASTVNAQLPVVRTWKPAQLSLLTPGGNWHVRTLPTGEFYEWQLRFTGLTQDEAMRLRAFHQQMEGSFHCFRFADPNANLLAWSEDLTQAPWSCSAGLSLALSPSPVKGIAQAVTITNSATSEALVSQTVGCDPTIPYSVAMTVRSALGSPLGLLIGAQRGNFLLTPSWQRVQFSAVPGGTADQVVFAVAIPAGGQIEIAGVQADAGADSPEYRLSQARQGIYSQARFKDDALILTCAQGGVYSANVAIIASAEV
jgi:hypothetical protein